MTKNVTKETHKPHIQSSAPLLGSLEHLTGTLTIKPKNDYMFRAVLQSNKKALKGLLSALLDIPIKNLIHVDILNPIILGEAFDDKTIILDLNILLNNGEIINLEMQILNQGDWTERSLYYLCKNFAQLKQGQTYKDILPVTHIGIVDFSPFPENQQFYSEYYLRETKTNHKYSDKLCIRMLNLIQAENVTDEEKQSTLYQWAKLFKATTWEEIKMLADKDSSISEFSSTLYEMSEDEKIYQQCLARERYERDKLSCIAYGKKQGIEQGREQERKVLGKLYELLVQANRSEDFLRACSDSEYLKELLTEFNLA